jgi:hypothetical protein
MWDGWVEGRAIWSLGARAGADLGSETLPMGLAVGREGDRTLFLFIETRSSVGGLHRFLFLEYPCIEIGKDGSADTVYQGKLPQGESIERRRRDGSQ